MGPACDAWTTSSRRRRGVVGQLSALSTDGAPRQFLSETDRQSIRTANRVVLDSTLVRKRPAAIRGVAHARGSRTSDAISLAATASPTSGGTVVARQAGSSGVPVKPARWHRLLTSWTCELLSRLACRHGDSGSRVRCKGHLVVVSLSLYLGSLPSPIGLHAGQLASNVSLEWLLLLSPSASARPSPTIEGQLTCGAARSASDIGHAEVTTSTSLPQRSSRAP